MTRNQDTLILVKDRCDVPAIVGNVSSYFSNFKLMENDDEYLENCAQ
jgi:hypothetical protein